MADSIDIVLPQDQSEGTSNTVGQWFKAVGDAVRVNDPLLEITTDKVTVEIAATADGVLSEIVKQEGETVAPGEVLGRMRGGSVAAAGEELSPAVRRALKEKGLDPAQVPGTGRGGRITMEDVEKAATRPGRFTGKRVPHTVMRKAIAEHMVRSVTTAPHVTAVFEADLSAVIAHRSATAKAATFTAYFVRASVAALQAVPEANGRWHPDAVELFEDCNIGIGTALEGGGLIAPVLLKAQELDLMDTARRLTDLTTRARNGTLEPREVQGGTFTISNHGTSGSLLAAPVIINQPQSAILGVGKVEQRVRVNRAGGFESRPMCYVSLTIDHRVLDGFRANAFLSKWVETIERWS
jgi:2-oxoglutarate dehydrogenase E2 component (dihydrolipoamide succinyltransferase)